MSQIANTLLALALPRTAGLTACTNAEGRFWARTPGGFAYVLNLLPQDDGLLIEAGFLFPTEWDFTASNRVLEKCGFLREGTIRRGKMVSAYCDYHIWGMLREDHAAAREEK